MMGSRVRDLDSIEEEKIVSFTKKSSNNFSGIGIGTVGNKNKVNPRIKESRKKSQFSN